MDDLRIPGTVSLMFLVYLFAFLPWTAYRSASRLRAAASATKPHPDRRSVWISLLLMLMVLLFFAWEAARGFDYDIFALPPLDWRDAAAAAAALAVCFALRFAVRAWRSENERRRLVVYAIAPRTGAERSLWSVTVLLAGVAEEAAYRGVGVSILWYALGSFGAAVILSAVAFTLAHWAQGWKSGAMIFVIALVFQALVVVTGTLVVAMVVHSLYDFIAGYLIAKEASRYDAAPDPAP